MPIKGYKQTLEHRTKMSAALRGRIKSPEHRAKLAAAGRRENNHNWHGGRSTNAAGYVLILCPNHPFADNKGYVLEHRLVMEAHVGRVLLQTEVVHHINGDKADNRLENLMLFSSRGGHIKHHYQSSAAAKAPRSAEAGN